MLLLVLLIIVDRSKRSHSGSDVDGETPSKKQRASTDREDEFVGEQNEAVGE